MPGCIGTGQWHNTIQLPVELHPQLDMQYNRLTHIYRQSWRFQALDIRDYISSKLSYFFCRWVQNTQQLCYDPHVNSEWFYGVVSDIHIRFMFTLFLEDYLVESSSLIFLRWVETTTCYICHLGGRRSDFLLGLPIFRDEDVSFREGHPLLGRSARMFGWLSGAASVEYGNSGYPPVNWKSAPEFL